MTNDPAVRLSQCQRRLDSPFITYLTSDVSSPLDNIWYAAEAVVFGISVVLRLAPCYSLLQRRGGSK